MPTETRSAAAKRRRVAHGPLLGEKGDIPSCVLGRILGFLDIASLVQVSGCNSVLRKQVYDEHKEQLWRVIDFGTVSPDLTEQITDHQLASLLQNCHARDCCQVLKLKGCFGIRGSGLEPLRGSCWLREADLQFAIHLAPTGPSVDTDIVLPILSSMPPMASPDLVPLPENSGSLGLSLVKFHHETDNFTNYYRQVYSPAAAAWFKEFHQALREKAIQCRTKCDYCHGVIMEKCDTEDRSWIMIQSYCEQCMKYTCADMSCHGPAALKCQVCLLQCCQPFSGHSSTLCPNHTSSIYTCRTCCSEACRECILDGGFEGSFCDACGNFYCNENGCGDDHLVHCETCEEEFCLECNVEHLKECSADDGDEDLTETSPSPSSSD